jgi:hypothetical protein
MESGLGNSYFPVFRGGVHMDKWTPAGVQLDSRWILDKELAGLTPIKKRSKVHLDSRNPPGVHLESTWNLWLKVKSSEQVRSNKHDMSGYSGNRENKEKHGVLLDWCIKAHK